MITKQDIKNYSAREDLPGEVLVEIIIGKSVDELEGCRQSHTMYPDLSPADIQKAFPAYKTLSSGMINRFHKEPSTQSHKTIRIKLKDAIPVKDFCSWFNNGDLPCSFKKQSGFILNSQAKLFIKLVLGKLVDRVKHNTGRHAQSRSHKKEIRRIAKSMWKRNKTMSIADMIISDEVNAIRKPDETNYSERTLRDWIKDLAPSRKSGRRPKNN